MSKPLSLTIAALVAASLFACNKDNASTGGNTAQGVSLAPVVENPNLPVAKYNDKVVTLKEVDDKISGQLKELEKKKLELRMQTAEQIVLEALAKAEAAKVGKTDEQWVKEQLTASIPPPPDAEIQKVWDENKDKMPPGSTFEGMREQIISFLQRDKQKEVAMKLFDDLKTKANYQLLLEEPRVQVAATGPARGPADAKVTIVEFSDFECPYCGKAEESVSQVMEKYAGKVRIVFRHFPLSFHPHAPKAAEASMCANDQGKFWEMHKQLFANRTALAVEDLKKYAGDLGLDTAKFNECLDSGKMKAAVDADTKAGGDVGVTGTPAFFINGKSLSGAQPFSEFQKVIDAELKKGG
ncbi:MAG: thioredoxin domain-containing protein [Myxococcaceae bacterium]